jgi:cation diffusion facilitator family transporter
MNLESEKKIISKTTLWTIFINLLLAIGKILAGVFGQSIAILTDAVNSLSDVLTNLVVMIVGRFSRKATDESHPYGHEKFESMVSVMIGVVLMITAFEIGKYSVNRLYEYLFHQVPIAAPMFVALWVGLATIVIKEFLYHYTKHRANKSHSSALSAMAMDHRSDVLASSGVVIGVGGAMLGYVYLEPIAAIIICFFIVRVGYRTIKAGFSQVVDQAADPATVSLIEEVVMRNPKVRMIDDLKTRMFGMKLYVDLEVSLDRTLSLEASHCIAHEIHDAVEKALPEVKHIMVHVNPYLEKPPC